MVGIAVSELRQCARRFWNRRSTRGASLLTLATAIVVCVSAWSLIVALYIYPLPVEHADQLYVVASGARGAGAGAEGLTFTQFYSFYRTLADSGRVSQVLASGRESVLVTVGGDSTLRAVHFVSDNYLSALGIPVAVGRDLGGAADGPGSIGLLVSSRFAKNHFGGPAQSLGRHIMLGRVDTTIVGVVPAFFAGLDLTEVADLYAPLSSVEEVLGRGRLAVGPVTGTVLRWLTVVVRLSSMTKGAATERISRLTTADGTSAERVQLVPVSVAALPQMVRADTARFASLLGGTVCLVLVTACLAVATMLLIELEEQRTEIAVKVALGATMSRNVCGLLLDVVAFNAVGLILAWPAAAIITALLGNYLLPGGVDGSALQVGISSLAVAVAAGAGVTITFLAAAAGLATIRSEMRHLGLSRMNEHRRPRVLPRHACLAGQVAVAVVLLSATGMLTRTVASAVNGDEHRSYKLLVTTQLQLWRYGYSAAAADDFYEEVKRRLANVPSVASVSMSSLQTSAIGAGGRLTVDGKALPVPRHIVVSRIDKDFAGTFRVSAIEGRLFSAADFGRNVNVALASASLADFLGGSAVGRRIVMRAQPDYEVRVVGVVPDIVTDYREPRPMALYLPVSPELADSRSIIVAARHDSNAAIRDVRSALRSIDPAVRTEAFSSVAERMDRQIAPLKFAATLVSALAGVAVMVVLLGAYLFAETVITTSRRELGIRLALGATYASVRRRVLWLAARVACVGALIGVSVTVIGYRLAGQLVGLHDPMWAAVVGSAAGMGIALVVVASMLPMVRIAGVSFRALQ